MPESHTMTTLFTDDLLSIGLVASALDCAETTVEERARTGDLPGIKLGRGWVFPRAALMQSLCELAHREAAERKNKPAPRLAIATTRPSRRQVAPVLPRFSS